MRYHCLLVIAKKHQSEELDERRQVFFNDHYETDKPRGKARLVPQNRQATRL